MGRRILALVVIFLLISYAMAFAGSAWKPIYNKEGIQGYERPVPGSNLKEFKAEGIVNARLDVVDAVIADIPNYPKWMGLVFESRLIQDISDKQKMVYLCFDSPWPVEDREVIATSTIEADPANGKFFIRFEAAKDPPVPERKGRVRIKQFTGAYTLEYVSKDKTKVSYSHISHPGGSLAVSAFNMTVQWLPLKNVAGLRRMVTNPVYTDAAKKLSEMKPLESVLHKE